MTDLELLKDLLLDISSDHLCAGHHEDIEHIVWDSLHDGPFYPRLSRTERRVLARLRDGLKGWVHATGTEQFEFVPMTAWLALHEKWRKR